MPKLPAKWMHSTFASSLNHLSWVEKRLETLMKENVVGLVSFL